MDRDSADGVLTHNVYTAVPAGWGSGAAQRANAQRRRGLPHKWAVAARVRACSSCVRYVFVICARACACVCAYVMRALCAVSACARCMFTRGWSRGGRTELVGVGDLDVSAVGDEVVLSHHSEVI